MRIKAKKGLDLLKSIMNTNNQGQNGNQRTILDSVIQSDEFKLKRPVQEDTPMSRVAKNDFITTLNLRKALIMRNSKGDPKGPEDL